MPFALQNHFSRGTCPQLVIQWVRDQYFGPTAPAQSDPPPPKPRRTSDPSTMVLGIKTAGLAPDCTDLIHTYPAPLMQTIAFVPEARLYWYAQIALWTCHVHSLLQVLMKPDKIFTAVSWITAPTCPAAKSEIMKGDKLGRQGGSGSQKRNHEGRQAWETRQQRQSRAKS